MKKFQVVRLRVFKKLASKLRKDLAAPHSICLGNLARAHGYDSYEELLAQWESWERGELEPEAATELNVKQWLSQVSDAFGTEFGTPIGGLPAEKWFSLICAYASVISSADRGSKVGVSDPHDFAQSMEPHDD